MTVLDIADADRTDEEDVHELTQEVEAEERLDLPPIDLDGRAPVEAVEHHTILEASHLEGSRCAAYQQICVNSSSLQLSSPAPTSWAGAA
jgi:hypothetical protein